MKYYSLKSNYCPKSELLCQRHAQIIELQTLGHKCLMGPSQLVLRIRLFYFLQKSCHTGMSVYTEYSSKWGSCILLKNKSNHHNTTLLKT